jgi:hypothetical protein
MKVWHTDRFTGGFGQVQVTFPLDYTLVAEVDTDSPDEAFRLTNAIEQPWHLNEEVRLTGEPTRSTSVGDVIVADDNKTLFLVLPVGMKEYHGIPQKFPANLYGDLS